MPGKLCLSIKDHQPDQKPPEATEPSPVKPTTLFSPMEFKNCPRAVGRPKKRRFGAPSILKSQRANDDQEVR